MPSTGWHHADIVAAVRKKGTNLRQLSLAHGKAECTLRSALLRPMTPSNRIIAEFIGVPLHVLWPAWFDASGSLIPSRRQGDSVSQRESSRNRRMA